MVKKLSELYLDARRQLMTREDSQSAGMIARQLMCHVTGKDHTRLLADREQYASETVCRDMIDCVDRILASEPLAYVLGQWEFYGLDLYVDRNVLIPRDDTCAVTELAIRMTRTLPQDSRVLDLCTGSGCIGLAVAHRVKDIRVTLADISPDALAVARRNVARHRLSGRVACVQANALTEPGAFLGKFGLIVSNPPYVTSREMEELDPGVREFEPHLALHGGDDGLEFYRAIAKNYTAALKPGGYLCFEFGMGQADAVCGILTDNGYTILERTRDFNGRERAVLAQYGRKED